jgi:hypothetical protein
MLESGNMVLMTAESGNMALVSTEPGNMALVAAESTRNVGSSWKCPDFFIQCKELSSSR